MYEYLFYFDTDYYGLFQSVIMCMSDWKMVFSGYYINPILMFLNQSQEDGSLFLIEFPSLCDWLNNIKIELI